MRSVRNQNWVGMVSVIACLRVYFRSATVVFRTGAYLLATQLVVFARNASRESIMLLLAAIVGEDPADPRAKAMPDHWIVAGPLLELGRQRATM